jgi:hypothetical protein
MENETFKALKKLMKRDGKLHPRTVVDEARDESSPLHKHFEWDDSIAGEKYRLEQARTLICNVRIIPDEGSKKSVRAFVNLLPERFDGGGYRLASEVIGNAELRQQLIKTAIIELAAWRKRHSDLMDLAGPVWELAAGIATDMGVDAESIDSKQRFAVAAA